MKFQFPHEPYPVQINLATEIYDLLNNNDRNTGKFGIFESPTGTGKTLSILCGVLQWMQDSRNKQPSESLSQDQCLPDWILKYKEKTSKSSSISVDISIDDGEDDDISTKKRLKSLLDADSHFLPIEYDSEHELESRPAKVQKCPKLIYCSRTHSQLTQVANEFKKTSYASKFKIQIVASRKQLCINRKVMQDKSTSTQIINERCSELCKQKENINRCPYYTKEMTSAQSNVLDNFSDALQSQIRDIEETLVFAKAHSICPYFGSRNGISTADILLVPYNLILVDSARDSVQIPLKDSIIVFDEAHNLTDCINGMYSASLSVRSINSIFDALNKYCAKFRARFSGKTSEFTKQLLTILKGMINFLHSFQNSNQNELVVGLNEFLNKLNIDNINLYKLVRFMRESHICYKLVSYFDGSFISSANSSNLLASNQQEKTCNGPSALKMDSNGSLMKKISESASMQSLFFSFTQFISLLGMPEKVGKLFVEKDENCQLTLKFTSLHPAYQMERLLEGDPHKILLVGGTMQPLDIVFKELFTFTTPADIKTYIGEHVINSKNIICSVIRNGTTNSSVNFNFTYSRRDVKEMIDECGRSIVNLCQVIPNGIVVFFTSYSYLNSVVVRWKEWGIFNQLQECKKVFIDEKASSMDVEQFLQRYSDAARSECGALLLSVVGGKLSEGINFADELARCVAVVGMPYPNANSIEVKERMGNFASSSGSLLDSICMQSVNQSIGRAIRHKKDYAVVLLMDERYDRSSIRQKMPKWFRENLTEFSLHEVEKFFINKR